MDETAASPGGRISHGFARLDDAGAVGPAVAYLDAQASLPFWRQLKRESVATLGLRPGMRAIDVGCGTGAEVRAMAERVAGGRGRGADGKDGGGTGGGGTGTGGAGAWAEGEAVGVDPSAGLLEIARARAASAGTVGARFVAGRAEDLPFADGSVDAARCERTLQHADDVDRAVAELARVVRPGGAVALVEPDWDTLVLDVEPHETAREVAGLWREHIPQPTVGRTLARRLHAAGFRGVTARARTTVITSLAYADQQFDLTRIAGATAGSAGVDPAAAAAWLRAAREQDAHGRFLAAATYFVVTARRGPRRAGEVPPTGIEPVLPA